MVTHRTAAFVVVALVPYLGMPHGRERALDPSIRITPHVGNYLQPAVSDDTVVWFDARRSRPSSLIPGTDIYGINLRMGREFRVTTSPTADYLTSLLISGETVLWADCRHCHRGNGIPGYEGDDILIRNLRMHREFLLPLHLYGQLGPWLLSGLAVWGREARGGSVTWYAANSVDGKVRPLASDRPLRALLKNKHFVVWGDSFDIWVGDLITGHAHIIARHAGIGGSLRDPVVSGHRVVWTRWPLEGPVSIEGMDLQSGKRFHVMTLPVNHYNPQFGPDKTLTGTLVAWVQTRNPISSPHPGSEIVVKDIVSGRRFVLGAAGHDFEEPAVGGNRLVYVDVQNANTGQRWRTVLLSTRLPGSMRGEDPLRPMEYRGGD